MYSLGRLWPLSGIRQHSTRRMLSMLVLGSRKHESKDKRPDDIGHNVKCSQKYNKEYASEENDFSISGEGHRLFPGLGSLFCAPTL